MQERFLDVNNFLKMSFCFI